MDSLDAQCLLIELAEGDFPAPNLWRHHRSGALSCAYEGGKRIFTWPAEDVAEIARTWRDSHARRTPERAQSFVDAHEHLEAMISEGGLGRPDMIIHDLDRAELRGIWEHEKVVLVVEGIGESASAQFGRAWRRAREAAGRG